MIRTLDRQAKRRHVVDGLTKKAIELLVGGANLENRLVPIPEPLANLRLIAARDAVVRRRETGFPVAQLVEQAAMPSGSWCKVDFEADTAIGIDRSRPILSGHDSDPSAEIPIAID